MENFFWVMVGLFNGFIYPDTCPFILKQAQYGFWTAVLLAVVGSSFGILLLYQANRGSGWLVIKLSYSFPSLVRLTRWLNLRAAGLIRRGGYAGLIVLVLIPIIPYLKEAALAIGQIFGLRYTLFVVLFFNFIRLFFISYFVF